MVLKNIEEKWTGCKVPSSEKAQLTNVSLGYTNDSGGTEKINGNISHQFPSIYQVISALPGACNYHNTVDQSQVISHLWGKN